VSLSGLGALETAFMTLNARFILKCASRTARLTYVRCGFRIRRYA